MNIYPLGYEMSLRDIANDALTAKAVGIVVHHRELLGLFFQVLRRFHSVAEIDNGSKAGRGPRLDKVVRDYSVRASLLSARHSLADALDAVYRKYSPGENRVRGALLEALVERSLTRRYSAPSATLENNLKFALMNGSARYTSGEQSVDVIGFDGALGECHDCKVNATRFERAWVHELQRDVAPHGFKIGLVTATGSKPWAEEKLRERGITLTPATTLITSTDFHPLVPLQQ